LGDITPEKVSILQDVDAVFIDGLKLGLYESSKLEQFFFL
jgi:GMP synthase (glutamine-hydrolysing)